MLELVVDWLVNLLEEVVDFSVILLICAMKRSSNLVNYLDVTINNYTKFIK